MKHTAINLVYAHWFVPVPADLVNNRGGGGGGEGERGETVGPTESGQNEVPDNVVDPE
jgi:hypothetical protein